MRFINTYMIKNSTAGYAGIHASGDWTSTFCENKKQARSMKEECSKMNNSINKQGG